MLLELLGMKLDPEGSREQELDQGQEQSEQAGLGSAEPRERGEG